MMLVGWKYTGFIVAVIRIIVHVFNVRKTGGITCGDFKQQVAILMFILDIIHTPVKNCLYHKTSVQCVHIITADKQKPIA